MKKFLFFSMITLASFLFFVFFVMLISRITQQVFTIGETGKIEKRLTIKPIGVQDSLDFASMLRNCVKSGKISISQPQDDEDKLAKMAKECEKRMKDKTFKIRENGKTYQELLNFVE